MPSPKPLEYPIMTFASPKDWEKWLGANHAKALGVWLRHFKKDSGMTSVTYAEALDVALCYGWVDSQKRGLDAVSFVQKWTPRRAKSMWSKVNREHVARLIKEKRMRAPGLTEVERAKKDGRWDAAYDSPSQMKPPADFLKALHANKKATAFYATLSKANTYAISWRVLQAKKPETRVRRIAQFVEMLAKGEKLH